MIKPSKLCAGDTIGIVAPASSFNRDNFKRGITALRRFGYKVKYERCIFNDCWSKPGHDKERAFQINRMFADEEVKAIVCAKAGRGSQEIISFLDPLIIQSSPKIFVGYSDITILLLYLQKLTGMVVFHGPVISGEFFRGMNPDTVDSFTRLLGKIEPFGRITGTVKALKDGKASGQLIGGNLELVLKSIGTDYEIDTNDKVFFIEEINETLEEIFSRLTELREKGKFDKVKGVVFGRLTNCYDEEDSFLDYIREFFKEDEYPILYNFPSGHTEGDAQVHYTLPLGVNVDVETVPPSVTIKESAVQ